MRNILLLAAAALLAVAPSTGEAAPSKEVGGSTDVFTEPRWQSSSRLKGLEFRDETVYPSHLAHDEPFVRFSIRNGLGAPRTFAVSASCELSAVSRKTVSLGPAATATIELPIVFAYELGYNRGLVSILIREPDPPPAARAAGATSQESETFPLINGISYQSGYPYNPVEKSPSVLLSRGITRDAVLPAFKSNFNTVELWLDAEAWPRDFRAYLPFDAVCLAREVADALPEETRAALRAFELLGGVVVTSEGGGAPNGFSAAVDVAKLHRLGDVVPGGRRYSSPYAASGAGISDHISRVPLEVKRSLPVGFLLALLALVAIVVMPGAVVYCSRRNRRLLLLAVLPGAALALTVVVALVALAAYGTCPTIRVQAVTLLDPESGLAVTRGQFAVFAPGQVTGDISIPSDVSFRLRGRGNDADLAARFGETVRLEGRWAPPLTATFFDFERAERRRERLDVKRAADGRITVANLLGATVTGGVVQIGGRRYAIPQLEPGDQKTLGGGAEAPAAPSSARPDARPFSVRPVNGLRDILFCKNTNYGRDWPVVSRRVKQTSLPEGTYIVSLQGSPFFPSPIADRWTHGTVESIVAGKIEN